MSIVKHDIPILEHDTDQRAVIQPGHNDDITGQVPEKLVFAFLLDAVDEYAAKHNCAKIGEFKTITKHYSVYVCEHNGHEVCLCQAPLGSAAAVQLLDDLIARGVREIVAVGSCGALVDLPENEFLIPTQALRDEGASYHYLPPSRWVELDARLSSAIQKSLEAHGRGSEFVKVWSTDGFFRETAEMVNYRKSEGCTVVDMECAGLAACAKFRGAAFGQILFTADSLADVEMHDARDWGKKAFGMALLLALDAVTA